MTSKLKPQLVLSTTARPLQSNFHRSPQTNKPLLSPQLLLPHLVTSSDAIPDPPNDELSLPLPSPHSFIPRLGLNVAPLVRRRGTGYGRSYSANSTVRAKLTFPRE